MNLSEQLPDDLAPHNCILFDIPRHPVEMNLSEEVSVSVTEIEEGLESEIFWSTVSGKKNSYLSLLNGKKAWFSSVLSEKIVQV